MEFEQLIEGLKSPDRKIRKKSAEALGQLGDPRAIDPLIEALNDTHENVKKVVIIALGNFDDPKAISALVDKLIKVSPAYHIVHIALWKTLTKIGSPAVPELINALEHNDASVRITVIKILVGIKDDRVVGALIKRLKDEDRFVKIVAVEALCKLRDPKAIEPLLVCVGTKDNNRLSIPSERNTFFGDLTKFGAPAAPYLLDLLKSNDVSFRNTANWTLMKMVRNSRSLKELTEIKIAVNNFIEENDRELKGSPSNVLRRTLLQLLQAINERRNQLIRLDIKVDKKFRKSKIDGGIYRARQRSLAA